MRVAMTLNLHDLRQLRCSSGMSSRPYWAGALDGCLVSLTLMAPSCGNVSGARLGFDVGWVRLRDTPML